MPRASQPFTLPVELLAELKKRSTETDEPMSRIVERGVRLALQLAPAEEDDKTGDAIALTRSEQVMLKALTAAGPGWHMVPELVRKTGQTPHVAHKALLALAAAGKAFEWGPGRMWIDPGYRTNGEIRVGAREAYHPGPRGSCWGAEPPMAALERLIAGYRARGDSARPAAISAAIHLALGVAEIEPFRAACRDAFWPGATLPELGGAFQNFAEREAEALADLEAEREAGRRAEAAERERIAAELHEHRRLDDEYRDRLAAGTIEHIDPEPDSSWLKWH